MKIKRNVSKILSVVMTLSVFFMTFGGLATGVGATATATPSSTPIPILGTIVLQQGVDGYSGGKDQGSMYEITGNSGNYGAGQSTFYYFRGATGNLTNALIYFDLSQAQIPSNATIQSAQLSLYVPGSYYTGGTCDMFKITDPDNKGMWVEGTTSAAYSKDGAAWSRRAGSADTITTGWTNAAGSKIMDSANYIASGTITFSAAVGWSTSTDVISDVQDWVDGDAVNQGWYIRIQAGSSTMNMQSIASDQYATAAYRPKLTITYAVTTPDPNASPTPSRTPTPTRAATVTPTPTIAPTQLATPRPTIGPTQAPTPTSGPTPSPLPYPDGFKFIAVPNVLAGINPIPYQQAIPMPTVGQSFYDPALGEPLTCATVEGAQGTATGRHKYSKFDPFNKDKSLIILNGITNSYNFTIYKTGKYPYNQTDNIVMSTACAESFWDLNDPNKLYAISGFCFKEINTSTKTTTTIKDFSTDPIISPLITGCYRITTKEEGECSTDQRFWCFMIQGNSSLSYQEQYVFIWDRVTDTITGTYKLGDNEKALDFVGMSPSGNYAILGGLSYNGGNCQGLTMTNLTLTRFNRLDFGAAHADYGYDSNGNEVIILVNVRTDYIDMVPISWDTKAILTPGGSYEGTNRTKIMRLYYTSDLQSCVSTVHVSCNYPGWALISASFLDGHGSVEQNWLDKSMVMVKLDNGSTSPKAYYMAKTYNTTSQTPRFYWDETQAAITNDGKRIVWACDWDFAIGAQKVFMMQMDMPANWEETGLATIAPTPTNGPTSTATPSPTADPAPSPTPLAQLGDVNNDGRVTSVDALMALQATSGRRTLTNEQKIAADVNRNGTVTSVDALKILLYASGRIINF